MSNKKDLEYLQNQLGVRDSMILNRLIDNHLEKIYRLQQIIDKAIEYMEHYIEVEDAPLNERIKIEFEYVIDVLRGEDNE